MQLLLDIHIISEFKRMRKEDNMFKTLRGHIARHCYKAEQTEAPYKYSVFCTAVC